MPGFDNNETTDHMLGLWSATISGAGTQDAAAASWADDYTRHRSGGLRSTYTSVDNIIGRTKSGWELDAELTVVSGVVTRY